MANTAGSLCQKKSTRCLKIPLRSSEQIYIVFLLPILIGCAIYVINFAADLVVAIQHFRDGNPLWAISTITIMYLPAIAYFALTVSRPDWWMTEDDKLSETVIGWFGMQVLQLVAFPFFALYRFAGLIVLAVDATLLTGDERIKTLDAAAAPAAIELYFFLQAWFQGAPQAVLQTHLLFREYPMERSYQTVVVHMLCILMSIVTISIKAASFQRFESQRVNGRTLPWAMWLKKYREQDSCNTDEKKPLQIEATDTTTTARSSVAPLIDSSEIEAEVEKGEEDKRSSIPGRINLERQASTTPPLPPKNVQAKPPPTPIRGLTRVASLPIPEMPAPPRPDSIIRDAQLPETERRSNVVLVEEVTGSTSAKTKTFRIPKRKYSIKGLEEDDPVGKFVASVWWFFFILARVFAIAIFYEFYKFWLFGLVGIHYCIMITYIFCQAKYYDVTNFFLTLWLGFVYVFCIIEYRVKFKYADMWLFAYYALVILENSLMTVTWFVYADWSGFWYTYSFFAIFTSMALCIMSAGVYTILFKPEKRRIYAS